MDDRELYVQQCQCDVSAQETRVKDAEVLLETTKLRLESEATERLNKLQSDLTRERILLHKEKNRLKAALYAQEHFTG